MESKGTVNDCCKVEENKIEKTRRPATNQKDPSQKGALVHKVCKMCSRNHYELIVDPIPLNAQGGKL